MSRGPRWASRRNWAVRAGLWASSGLSTLSATSSPPGPARRVFQTSPWPPCPSRPSSRTGRAGGPASMSSFGHPPPGTADNPVCLHRSIRKAPELECSTLQNRGSSIPIPLSPSPCNAGRAWSLILSIKGGLSAIMNSIALTKAGATKAALAARASARSGAASTVRARWDRPSFSFTQG